MVFYYNFKSLHVLISFLVSKTKIVKAQKIFFLFQFLFVTITNILIVLIAMHKYINIIALLLDFCNIDSLYSDFLLIFQFSIFTSCSS